MQDEISHLLELQNLDLEIRTLSLSSQDLPANLHDLEMQRLEAQKSLEGKEKQLEELKQHQRHLESEIAMLIEGITRSRQRLMEIKDNIEYKAMLREIAFKEDRKDQMETEMLQLLEDLETQKTAVSQEQAAITVLEQDFTARQAEVEQELNLLNEKIAGFQQSRQDLLGLISKTLLKKYDFIRNKRNGLAVAEVRQGVCQACHMNIPPQQFIELQKDQEILACPHCQRIIYWLGPPPADNNGEANAA